MGGKGEEAVTLALDTSALVALANRRDPSHRRAVTALENDPGPFVVPAGILAEAGYMLEARLGLAGLDAFLIDVDEGRLLLDCGEEDVDRIRELVSRYADLPLGFADAAVAACAERREAKVFTLDRRDFDVVAGEGRFEIVP
jgi:predicted nucleic acid-binding protein